jgi:hypothetical protein
MAAEQQVIPSTINMRMMVVDETGQWVPLKSTNDGLNMTNITTGVTVPNGGTGQASFTDGAFLIGNGSNALSEVGPGTAGQIPISQGAGADPVMTTPTGAGKFFGGRGGTQGAFYPTQILSKSSNYPLVTDDYGATVLCTAAITVTLPAPGTVGAGWWCCIKKTVAAGSDVTIARNASETIDGRSASDVLKAQYAHAVYITDGTNWHVASVNDWTQQTRTSGVSAPTAGQFGDVTASTLSLPPGEWDASAVTVYDFSSSTTALYYAVGIGTASGNSASGLVSGDNYFTNGAFGTAGGSVGAVGLSLVAFRISVASTTSYYSKMVCNYTGTAPTVVGRISARRVG